MDVHINLWGVLLAGLSSMAVGMIYYADSAFGHEWRKLARVDKEKFQKRMNKIMPQLFGAALVTAFVVAYFTFLYHHYFDVSWIQAGLATSLVMWLGGAATTVFIHNTTDMRPIKLTDLCAE
jgi:UDP-N-acetylmuramyl pentapeptide phosphotransferase/UDP-N-acetylglucosamine-1-phosphate transferase